jgi:hypothetical protein
MSNYAKINPENIVDSVIVSTESFLKELSGNFVDSMKMMMNMVVTM